MARWAIALAAGLGLAGCGDAAVAGLDPVLIRLEGLDLFWVYGQEEPGGPLSVRVEVEFDVPWGLCGDREMAIPNPHTVASARFSEDGSVELPSADRIELTSRKWGRCAERVTFGGPLSKPVEAARLFFVSIVDCGGPCRPRGRESFQFFRAPDPERVPIWRTTFTPTDD